MSNELALKRSVEEIWKEYHSRLFSFIVSRVNDETAADDILQNVFLKIHAKLDTLKDDRKIRGWIYQITRNAIIDYYRSHRITEDLPGDLTAAEPDTGSSLESELSSCMIPMIESLPDKYSEAIKLSEIDGLKQREVAEQQGLTLSGAKARIQRGRRMVKKILQSCCDFSFDRHGNLNEIEVKDNSLCINGNCDC